MTLYSEKAVFGRIFAALMLILVIAACPMALFADGMADVDPSLVGTWRWTGATTPVAQPKPLEGQDYTVTFTDTGEVHMKVEVNIVNGTYTADGRNISFKPPMAMTLAAWMPSSPAPVLIQLMEKASTYAIDGETLTVTDSDETSTAAFIRLR